MLTSKSSDATLNSERRESTNPVRLTDHSTANNNIAREHSGVGRVPGLPNSSSSHVENQMRSAVAPIVSVISSSMEIFGSTESNHLQRRNNIDRTTTASSYPVSVNLPVLGISSEMSKHGNSSPQSAAGTSNKKAEQASSIKLKSMKRAINTDDASKTENQKKFKLDQDVTEEEANHSTNHGNAEKNALDMSFERAAVVAALSTLYGTSGDKLNSKRPATTNNTAALNSASVPMPRPKQVMDTESQYVYECTLPISGDAMVGIAMQDKPLMNTADIKPPAPPLDLSQLGVRKKSSEERENSTVVQMGPSSTEEKDSPTSSRKSSITQYPTQYDVLLGRGKSNKNHPGNVWFQDYILANRDRYFNAPTNVQKRQITMEIYETIRKKGRFLRRGAQGWVDVSTADVQQKVAHALQYRRRCELREQTPGSSDSNNPHISTISHPPHRIGTDNESGENVQNTSNFDANAIALAMVTTAGNYSMARLDPQTRQEQYKVNQEYYQNYLKNLQRPIVGSNRNDTRLNSAGDVAIIGDRATSGLPQSHHPLHALALSQVQRMNQPRSLHHPSNVSTIPDASSSSTMSNLLLQRLSNIDYRNNAILNSISAVTNFNPSSVAHIIDSSSTTDEQQSSAPSSENLDSSGLHSLADVITQLYSQEETDGTKARGRTRG